jgi:hypothetical protein
MAIIIWMVKICRNYINIIMLVYYAIKIVNSLVCLLKILLQVMFIILYITLKHAYCNWMYCILNKLSIQNFAIN